MKRLIIVLLTLTCSYAFAEWELIDNNVQGYFFVDRSSLRKTGSTTKIWTKVDLIAPETLSNGKQFMSAKTLFVFECMRRLPQTCDKV
jgi:hypothetical protein